MPSSDDNTHKNNAGRWWIAAFGLTILLSAFLLFQVQPVVSKRILPWFGGAPSVWTTCLLFFQTLLFGGYLYAHLLQRWLSPRHQVAVHLALVVVALALLPAMPGVEWKPVPGPHSTNPTWQILLLLSVTVGIPYFVLSATSPLVQAWFSGAYPGRSPYRLYALSNAGSLAALLSYPFFFEPMFNLDSQSTMWSGAFVVYAVLCAVLLACAWNLRSFAGRFASHGAIDQNGASPEARPGWLDRLRWLALPACASLMLLAATNHVCQDVAVVPFLWVMPLSLYLLSFIISFDHARWYVRPLWAVLAVVTLAGAAGNDVAQLSESPPLRMVGELTLYLTAMFSACMVCHGELYRLKPAPRYLTEFYLYISAGGALGGVFVAIVAPLIFSNYLEWPIGVAATFILSVGLLILPKRGSRGSPPPESDRAEAKRRGKRGSTQSAGTGKRRLSPDFITGVFAYAVFGFVVAVGLLYVAVWGGGLASPLARTRNFFGVVSVVNINANNPEFHELQLQHGRIRHGRQSADPQKRRWPTSYYGEQSGAGQAIRYYQKSGPIRVGLIGLGIGTLAAYARPDDYFRFYEINPAVIDLAENYFTYLYDCRGKWDIVLGDARLSLEAEEPQKFDVLVLDAFSGDAIPTHLLTREAFEIYRRHLKPNGAIAVHISNSYLRLGPVVRGLAEDCGMKTTRLCTVADESRLVDPSEWIVVTRNEDFLRTHPSQTENMPKDDLHVPLWTDQYSNLFRILVTR